MAITLNTHLRIQVVSTKTEITVTYCYNSAHPFSPTIAYKYQVSWVMRCTQCWWEMCIHVYIIVHTNWCIQVKIRKALCVNIYYSLEYMKSMEVIPLYSSRN